MGFKLNLLSRIALVVTLILLPALAEARCENASSTLSESLIEAKTSLQHSIGEQSVLPCSEIPKKNKEGTVCISKSGIEFERVEGGWKDRSSGIAWHDKVKKNVDFQQASLFCQKKGLEIPSKSDFEVALSHGFLELFPKIDNLNYWTTTTANYYYKRPGDLAYQLNPETPGFDVANRTLQFETYTARCMSR